MSIDPFRSASSVVASSTGVRVPHLSPQRQDTLETIDLHIDAFAEHLFQASKSFSKAKAKEAGSDDAKSDIFEGKRHVHLALHELDSTTRLVSLAPDHTKNIASILSRVQNQLNRIILLSERLTTTLRIQHYPTTLETLTMACPRASYKLENSLGVSIKLALKARAAENGPSKLQITS
jgi:hypothetical protein